MNFEVKTSQRVAIVAAGIVSPLGFGLTETLQSLRQARDCVTPVTAFSVEKTRCKTAAQIDDGRLLDKANRSRQDRRLHRASYMVRTALAELLERAREFEPEIAIVGTTSGGMSFGENFYRTLGNGGVCSAALIANYPPQKQIVDAMEKFGINAPAQVIANACASGTNAIGHAFNAIRTGRCQRILAGGYDALSELVFVGFDSLQAATPEKCRPFDSNRSGMVLGEGAALLALEELESARSHGAEILGEITGYGISTDNHHLTQPNPDGSGPRRAMEQALAQAQLEPNQVGYINAHGTATVLNDTAEGKAIAELFGDVPVSSTKSMMGHSLGAAGAIEAVVSLLALQHQFLPPNINFREAELSLNIVANEARDAQFDCAISNSFGFGGTNATIVLRRFAR
ncbi:MAG: beta-ketoacyl-[acyl-carrier-protein] synthase family protein [Verrucomicrobia bacterium]|nr:MAG: beta-ketoacyl-[acyl-carrier-protein] synthase family protein [Verrucomicrobiota bacterium]PYL89327.1 MAG: beta-ketoacyl-[acyl-carrier-protein] synthase family protein [Verrucomicrobiota bacterium]